MAKGFTAEVRELVRKAVAESRRDLLYEMAPSVDGGQTYEMKCKICGASGNILASRFSHGALCPVEVEERKLFGIAEE